MQQPVLVFQVCAYRLVTDYYGEVEGQRGVTVGLIRHWWRRHNRMEGKRKNSRDKHREHSEAVRVRQTAYKHKPSEWGARGASCFIYELICTGGGLGWWWWWWKDAVIDHISCTQAKQVEPHI